MMPSVPTRRAGEFDGKYPCRLLTFCNFLGKSPENDGCDRFGNTIRCRGDDAQVVLHHRRG